MCFSWPRLAVLVAALSSGACSTLVNPNSDLLGANPDAGVIERRDAGGPLPGTDAGPPPPREDGGPLGRDAATPPPPPPMDAGCELAPSCAAGVLTTCDGAETCPLGCAPGGSPRCAEMVPSNLDTTYWRADARDLVIETDGEPVGFDTSACTSVSADTMIVAQADGSEVCVLMVHDFVVRSDSGIVIFGSRPMILMASGDVNIEAEGFVSANARGHEPGPGGSRGGNIAERDGAGDHFGRAGENVPTYHDGGGGGGAFCGAGGRGGRGGSAGGGEGGGRDGDVNLLIPLRGGSGGGLGSGGRLSPTDLSNAGLGGGSGGALQISARGTIRIDGYIGAGGGGGGGGLNDAANWGSGGGGGSGGGVLLEAPIITIGPSAAITTSGGGGGAGASDAQDGETGTNGGETLGRAGGGFRGGNDFGADGGDSGGGGMPDGADGAGNRRGGANGGGAGGGVGCVVYRTLDGTRPANARMRTSGNEGTSLMSALIRLR